MDEEFPESCFWLEGNPKMVYDLANASRQTT